MLFNFIERILDRNRDKCIHRAPRRTYVLLLLVLVSAAPLAADDLSRILRKLDAAAEKFKTASADFEWDATQTQPILDSEVQKGAIFFKRTDNALQVAAHIRTINDKKAPKILTYSKGHITLYEGVTGELRVFDAGERRAQLESFLLVGFGTSGKEIERKWVVVYLRSEKQDSVKCAVLELVPRDPAVKKDLRKATIWVDAERGVCLKQILDQGPSTQRVSIYTNMKVNAQLPEDSFDPRAIRQER